MKQSNQRNLYQAGYAEIFFKNFLAGVARGLGGLFVWFIMVFIIYRLLWPQLQIQIDKLNNLMQNLPTSQTTKIIPQDFTKLFETYVPK